MVELGDRSHEDLVMATACSYLEIHSPDDIRIAGTRVGLEHLLALYLDGYTAEEIAMQFPTVSLEQVHGVIAYYLGHREEVNRLLGQGSRGLWCRAEQAAKPVPEVVQRIRKILQRRGQA